MRNLSRFIPVEEIGRVAEWQFTSMDAPVLSGGTEAELRLEDHYKSEMELARQRAYTEGFTEGRARASIEAQHQMSEFIAGQGRETAKLLADLFSRASGQIENSHQVIARGVLDLACDVARQVLRRELSIDQSVLQPVIKEALDMLVGDANCSVLRLNPADLEVLDVALKSEFSGSKISFVPDASFGRGGCIVESAGQLIDATLEKRWSRVVGSLGLEAVWTSNVEH